VIKGLKQRIRVTRPFKNDLVPKTGPGNFTLTASIIFMVFLSQNAISDTSQDTVSAQALQELFQQRFDSFKSSGYDPLTTPPEWYRPTEQVRGLSSVPIAESPVAPGELGVSVSALKAAAAYAEAQNSTALLVWQAGDLQLEQYWQGQGRESFFNPQSMSKTVLALMTGIALRDGYLNSVDDAVGDYIEEWAQDPRGQITVRQLLQMSGGLAQISDSYEISLDNPAVYQHFGTDFVAPILALPQADPPGSRWDYNNNETNLLGVVLERASGKRYADYLSASLWQPMGLSDARLYMDRPDGEPMFSCCILSRPMDWLMLGILVLQNGQYNGEQIVPAEWIAQMRQPADTNAGYGYLLWLGDYAVADKRPEPAYMNQPYSSEAFADPATVVFRGFGYQRVWVMPAKQLVVVRAGRDWPEDWDNTVIPNVIFRGTP